MGDLKCQFKTLAWQMPNLWEEGSEFMLIIQGLPGWKHDKMSKTSLECLALLWCQGTNYDRAIGLYECVNPPCHQDQEAKIAFNDKDWRFVLPTIMEISSKLLIDVAFRKSSASELRQQ